MARFNCNGSLKRVRQLSGVLALGLAWLAMSVGASAATPQLLGVGCEGGKATDPKTGRSFLLGYPCDLRAGDKVVFILLLHGAGSSGDWVRQYFPAASVKETWV